MLAIDPNEGGEAAEERARALLEGRSFANPIRNVYVVRLDADDPEEAEDERTDLQEILSDLARHSGIEFLLSPVMAGGSYQGFVAVDSIWDEVNRRSR